MTAGLEQVRTAVIHISQGSTPGRSKMFYIDEQQNGRSTQHEVIVYGTSKTHVYENVAIVGGWLIKPIYRAVLSLSIWLLCECRTLTDIAALCWHVW